MSRDPSGSKTGRDETKRSGVTLYRVWAVAASLLCVAFAAYILLSKLEESRSMELRRVARAAEAEPSPSTTTAPSQGDVDSSPSPDAPVADAIAEAGLAGLQREWISISDASRFVGYAILIDVDRRRELIVERCRHAGHFDDERGEPNVDVFPCETRVAGRIATVDDGSLIVLEAGGRGHRIPIQREGAGDDARLTLVIGGEQIAFEPGSKNDLLQRFERRPEIQLSKERGVQFELDRLEEERRRREATTP